MPHWKSKLRRPLALALCAVAALGLAAPAAASEAELVLPDLGSVSFLGVTGLDAAARRPRSSASSGCSSAW